MEDYLLKHHEELLSYAFNGTLAVVVLWELLKPRHRLDKSIWVRWASNLGMGFLNAYMLRFLFPLLIFGVAISAQKNQVGLFHLIEIPLWLSVMFGVILMDFLSYWIHRALHLMPFLWRLHLVHHADPDVDFSTSSRHHPFEVIVSSLVSMLVVAAVGISPVAIAILMLMETMSTLFVHANVQLPVRVEKWLRKIIVTPEFHRVHHSSLVEETDSNYGVIFPWWDRLFSTYTETSRSGHTQMQTGLEYFRNDRDLYLDRLLILPFLKRDKSL